VESVDRVAVPWLTSSALLAVEVYNKPAVKFKSGGYVVMMIIAWTALLHAYFFNKRVNPAYKKALK
jgi:hypothetical protein